MQTNSLQLHAWSYSQPRTYLVATIFALGNILLPLAAHLVPQGGLILLPIYFFTLVTAYKYGWKAGLITAILSPVMNHLLFGMPPAEVLPAILIKSTLLALLAGVVAEQTKRLSILNLCIVVLGYQLIGSVAEWGMSGNLHLAIQDFKMGYPGLLFQIVGGYFVIKNLA